VVTSLWADERVYWPVHVVLHPASRLPGKERDPLFPAKPQLAVELVHAARAAGIGFRAVVADCAYGDNPGFTHALGTAKVPFVLALKPRKGTWAPADAALPRARQPPSSAGAARGGLANGGVSSGACATATPRPGGRPTLRSAVGPGSAAAAGGGHHRPGHAAGAQQLVLLTNLPRPASRRAQQANLAEVVRLYGLRNWVEQATSRSRVSWAGLTSRSARIGRSAATGRWCAARSRSAGRPSSLRTRPTGTV
jgi:DDE superfamily endonuclease